MEVNPYFQFPSIKFTLMGLCNSPILREVIDVDLVVT